MNVSEIVFKNRRQITWGHLGYLNTLLSSILLHCASLLPDASCRMCYAMPSPSRVDTLLLSQTMAQAVKVPGRDADSYQRGSNNLKRKKLPRLTLSAACCNTQQLCNLYGFSVHWSQQYVLLPLLIKFLDIWVTYHHLSLYSFSFFVVKSLLPGSFITCFLSN